METSSTNVSDQSVQRKKQPFLTMLSVLCALILVALAAVFVYPSPILRYVFSHIEAETGIVITFDRAYFYIADGSLLNIDGLTIKRENHPASNFDLTAASLQMPAMFPVDFYSPILYIKGLRGTYEKSGSEPKTASKNSLQALRLTNAQVDFIDRTPDNPFHVTVQIEEFFAAKTERPLCFEPYVCTTGQGQIGSAKFSVSNTDGQQRIKIEEAPLDLFASYAPVLDDIFESGSMNIQIDDLTDETQKRLHIVITLLSDCEIKSADKLLAPAIRAALQALDQSSMPALHDLKGKIERLKTFTESLRNEIDNVARIIDTLKVLAPPDVREKYENIKSRYDKAKNAYEEWNAKFVTLVHDIDKVKVGVVNDTFQHFIETGIPIELDIQEVDGEWQCDWYEMAIRLIEKNYRAIITAEYQKRIQEILDALDRLLAI
jgi:hypothetical protein